MDPQFRAEHISHYNEAKLQKGKLYPNIRLIVQQMHMKKITDASSDRLKYLIL